MINFIYSNNVKDNQVLNNNNTDIEDNDSYTVNDLDKNNISSYNYNGGDDDNSSSSANEEDVLPNIYYDSTLYNYTNVNGIINNNAISSLINIGDQDIVKCRLLVAINETLKVLHPQTTTKQILDFIPVVTNFIDKKLSKYTPTSEVVNDLNLVNDNLLVNINQVKSYADSINAKLDVANQHILDLQHGRTIDKNDNVINLSIQEINESLSYMEEAKQSISKLNDHVASLFNVTSNNKEIIDRLAPQLAENTNNVNQMLTATTILTTSVNSLNSALDEFIESTTKFITDTKIILHDFDFLIKRANEDISTHNNEIQSIHSLINQINLDLATINEKISNNKNSIITNQELINQLQTRFNEHVNTYEEAFANLDEQIIKNKFFIEIIKNDINNINNDITKTNRNVEHYIELFNDKFDLVNQTIQANKDEIFNIRNADIQNLTSRININKSNVEKLTDTVNENLITLFGTLDNVDKVLVMLNNDIITNAENDEYQFNFNKKAIQSIDEEIKTIKNHLITIHDYHLHNNDEINNIKNNLNSTAVTVTGIKNQLDNVTNDINNINLFNDTVEELKSHVTDIDVKTIKNNLSIASINETIQTINSNIDKITNDINALAISHENELLTQINIDLESIKEKIPLLEEKDTIFSDSISEIKVNVHDLFDTETEVKRRLDSINASIAMLESDLASANLTINDLSDKLLIVKNQDVAGLISSIRSNTGSIRTIQTDINSINQELQQNCFDIDASQKNIIELHNKLDDVNKQLEQLYSVVNGEKINEIDKQIEQINTDIEAINNSINNVTYINQKLEIIDLKINNLANSRLYMQEQLDNQIYVSVDEPTSAETQKTKIWVDPNSLVIKVKNNNQWLTLNQPTKTLPINQVVKDFIHALTTITDNDHVEGKGIINLAIKAISTRFNTVDELITSINQSYANSRVTEETLLLKSFDINFNNRGSILGNNFFDDDFNRLFTVNDANSLIYPQGILKLIIDNQVYTMSFKNINNIIFAFPQEQDLSIDRQNIVKIFANVYLPNILKLINQIYGINFNVNNLYLVYNSKHYHFNIPIIPVIFNDSEVAPLASDQFMCFTALDEIVKTSTYANILLTDNILDLDKQELIDKLLYGLLQTNIYKFTQLPIKYKDVENNLVNLVTEELPEWVIEGFNAVLYGINYEKDKIITVLKNLNYYLDNKLENNMVGFLIFKFLFKQSSLEEFI